MAVLCKWGWGRVGRRPGISLSRPRSGLFVTQSVSGPPETCRIEASARERSACRPTLFVRPVFWDKRWRLCPRLFYKRFLKPLISKIGVLSHDDLKSWSQLLGELKEPCEQPPN